MSVITQMILQADNELRYLTAGELNNLRDYLNSAEKRFRIINTLRDREKEIINQSTKMLFQMHPEYINVGGNAAGSKQRSLCIRDYGWYLRLITYGILAGDKTPIEKIGTFGVRDMYNSLNVPIIGMVDSIKCLKSVAISEFRNNKEYIEIVIPYFDYLAEAIAR